MLCARTIPAASPRSSSVHGTSQLSDKFATYRATKFLLSQRRHIEANFRQVFGVPPSFPRIIGSADSEGSTASSGLFSNIKRPEGMLFHVTNTSITSSLSLSLETAFEGTQKVKCSVRYALSPVITVVLASASSASIHDATFTALCRTLLVIPNERALNRLLESLSGYELRVLHEVHAAHGSQLMFSVVRNVVALPREPHLRALSTTDGAEQNDGGAKPQRGSAVATSAARRMRAAAASPWAKIVVHSTLLSDIADFERLGDAATSPAPDGGASISIEECRSLRFRRLDVSFYASVICTAAVSPPVSTLWGAFRNASRNAFNVLSSACGTPLIHTMELALEREVLALARTAARGDSEGAFLSQYLAGSLQDSLCSSDVVVAKHSLVSARTKRTRLPLREYRLISSTSSDAGEGPHRLRGFLQGDFLHGAGGRLPLCCKFTENPLYLGATPSSASILRSFVFAEAQTQAGVTDSAPAVPLNSLLPVTAELVRRASSVCAFVTFGSTGLDDDSRSPSAASRENRLQVDAMVFRVCVSEGHAFWISNDLRLRTPLFELEGGVALESIETRGRWTCNATDVAGVHPLPCVYAVLSRYRADVVPRSANSPLPTSRVVQLLGNHDESSRLDVFYGTLALTDAASAAFRRLQSRHLNASLVDFCVVALGGSCTLTASSADTPNSPTSTSSSQVAGCAFANPLLIWPFDGVLHAAVASGPSALTSSTAVRLNDISSTMSSIEVGNVPVMLQAMRDMLQLDGETGIPRLLVNQPVVFDLDHALARIAEEQTVPIDTSAEVTLSWPTAPQWSATLSSRSSSSGDRGGNGQSETPQHVLGLIVEVTTELYRVMMSHAHPGLDYAAVPVPTVIVRQPGTRKALDFLMHSWFGATPIERHVVLRRHEVVLQSPSKTEGRGVTTSLPATGVHMEIHRRLLLYDVLGVRLLLAGVHATDMPRAAAAIASTIATQVLPDQRNLRITRHSQRYSTHASGDRISSTLLFYVQKLQKMGMVLRLSVTASETTGHPLIEAQVLAQSGARDNRQKPRTPSLLPAHRGGIFSSTIAQCTVKEDVAFLRNGGEELVPHVRQPLKTLEALCVEALSANLTADRMDWISRVAEKCRVSVVQSGFPVRYDPTFYAPSNLLGEALQGVQGRYECIYHTTSGCDVVCRVVITAVCGVPIRRRGWDPKPGEDPARNVPPVYLVLGIGTGRTNRAAWRAAALDALQQNFPELLDEVASIRDLSDALRGAPFGQLRALKLHLPFRIRRWTDEAGRICCALRDEQYPPNDAHPSKNDAALAAAATGHPLDALVGRGPSTPAALRAMVTAVTDALHKPCSGATAGSFSDWDVTSNYSKSAVHAYLGALGTPLKAKMRWYVLPHGSAATGWFEIVCERMDAKNHVVPSRIYPISQPLTIGNAVPKGTQLEVTEWNLAVGQQLLCGLFGLLRHWAKLLPRPTQLELSELLQHLRSSQAKNGERSFRISKRHYLEQRLRNILGVQVECRVGCVGQTWFAGAYAFFPANPRHVSTRPYRDGQLTTAHHFVSQRIVVHCFEGQGASEQFALDDLVRAVDACEATWLVHEPLVGA